jgi:TRAP transporter TAXI family solute receptor
LRLAWLKLDRIAVIALVVFSVAIVGFIAMLVYQRSKVHRLTLAAGSPTGESYIICAALRTVVERHNSGIRIQLLETGGTVESLQLLDSGKADLVAAQADVPTGPSARILAILYDDTFQLLAPRESPIQNFADLRGKSIALPRSGGQFQSFLRVAGHFALHDSDFQFVGSNDAVADEAFAEGRADAIFRVRALSNPAIQHLVQHGNARLVRIDHAAAMKIEYPAFQPTVIPAGGYLGHPAVPAEDLPSVAVHRTLLAASSVDDETVRAIMGALIDLRQEVALEIPDKTAAVRLLLAQVRRPDPQAGLGPALHSGAVQFYEKDKPPFILAHADYMGLLLTVIVMVTSWIWEFKAWLQRQQKNISDEYSNRVIALMNAAREAKSPAVLDGIRSELLGILTTAVADLDADRLSEESFHSFRSILHIGLEVVRDSSDMLQTASR